MASNSNTTDTPTISFFLLFTVCPPRKRGVVYLHMWMELYYRKYIISLHAIQLNADRFIENVNYQRLPGRGINSWVVQLIVLLDVQGTVKGQREY